MTDNRTTELREKLTERGVKYDVKALRETEWTVNGVIWHANEYDGNLNVYVRNNDMLLTPEQAIAATLGSEREKQLESLARDMFAYIDKCCESDLSFGCVDPVDCAYYDKARDWCTKASSLKQRMKELGIGVIDE